MIKAGVGPLWSAIIPSRGLWTRDLPPATIHEETTPTVEGCFGYGPMSTPAPSSLAPHIHIPEPAGRRRALPMSLSPLTHSPCCRKSLSPQTIGTLSRAPGDAKASDQHDALRP